MNKQNYIKYSDAVVLIFLSFITFIVFFNTLNGTFLNWDDTLYITQNSLIKRPVSFESFKNLFYFDQHICLVLFTFLIQYNIFGLEPFSFHLINVLFHTINVILVYFLCKNLFKKEALCLIIALLFAVHPLRSETVGWLMQRKDILYTTFFIISLLSYQFFIKRRHLAFFVLIFLSSFLSSLCKIQAFSLPFIIILFEYYYRRKIDYTSVLLFIVVLLSQNLYKYQSHGNIGLMFFYIYFLILLPSYHIICREYSSNRKTQIVKAYNKISHIFKKVRFEYYVLIGYFFFFVTHKATLFPFLYLIFLILFGQIKNKYAIKSGKITDGLIFIVLIIISIVFYGFSINVFINVFLILIFIPYLYLKIMPESISLESSGTSASRIFNYIGLYLLVLLVKDYLYVYIYFPLKDINITDIFLFLFPFVVIKSKYIYIYFTQKALYKKIIFLIIIITLFSFLYVLINNLFFDFENKSTTPIINRIFLSFYSLNYYLHKFIYPFNLNAMVVYPEGIEDNLSVVYKVSLFIFLSILLLVAWLLNRAKTAMNRKEIIFGLLFFIINISLVLHIIPIGGKVLVADRYTYLAYLGLFISAVFTVDFLLQKFRLSNKVFMVFWGIVILILSYECYSRNKVWQNDQIFWTDIIEKDSTNHYARYSLGLYFYEKKKYEQAIEQYNRAISTNSHQYEYYSNRAACYVKLKRHQEAFDDFEKATQLNQRDYASYNNRGNLYLSTGKFENSIYDFRTALQIKNDYPEAAKSLEKAERLIKAREMYEQDQTQSKELSEYYNQIGVEKAMDKFIEEALPYFELSVKYDTINIDALKNRGNGYAILKRFEEAENDFIKVLRLKPDDAGTMMNLGNIKHETGYKNLACEYWKKAYNLGLSNAQFMIDKFCK